MEIDADDDLIVWLKLNKNDRVRVYTRLHELKETYDNFNVFMADLESRKL